MPSINMIAPRRAEKLRIQRDIQRLSIVIIAEILFAVCLGGWMCTKLWSTQINVVRLDEQLNKLKPVVEQIQSYQTATKQLAPKLELLNHAKTQTMCWYDTLDKLTQSLPSSTYLTRISTSTSTVTGDTKKQTTVILSGISSEQARVGETMMRLQAIPAFEKVNLSYTRKSGGKLNGIDFEIDASMKGDKESKGVKANGSNQS